MFTSLIRGICVRIGHGTKAELSREVLEKYHNAFYSKITALLVVRSLVLMFPKSDACSAYE
jgi:hypothetical protein